MPDPVNWSLPVVFRFSVKMDNSELSFSEVSGLETSIETMEVHSGGDNSTVYNLPKNFKYADLILKRAIVTEGDAFFEWCKKGLDSKTATLIVDPKPIEVSLLNAESKPLATWTIEGAYPFKWSFNTFDAMKAEVMIETVSLKYRSLKRTL